MKGMEATPPWAETAGRYWSSLSSRDSLRACSLQQNIIPYQTVSLCISSGCYFAVFSVILIMPAALVFIYTKYGLGEWHSTIFLIIKDVFIMVPFCKVLQRFYKQFKNTWSAKLHMLNPPRGLIQWSKCYHKGKLAWCFTQRKDIVDLYIVTMTAKCVLKSFQQKYTNYH